MYQPFFSLILMAHLMVNPFESASLASGGEMAQKTGIRSSAILQMIDDENTARQRNDTIPLDTAMDRDDITLTVARQLG